MKLKQIIESAGIYKEAAAPAPAQPAAPVQQAAPAHQHIAPIEQEKMSPEQKKQLLEMMNQFNECGKSLYGYGDVRQIAEKLVKVSELAESYALQESGEDFLQVGQIQKDMKEVRKHAGDLAKCAKDAWLKNEQMKALYEKIGGNLSRYYELN